MLTLTLTLLGPPRTKKNHGRRIWRRDKRTGRNRPYHVPSEAHELWLERVAWQARLQAAAARWPKCRRRVTVKALVYREALVGDHVGYTQAIGDMLEYAGVLADDKLIADWDGTRLLKDAINPRVEITISVLG